MLRSKKGPLLLALLVAAVAVSLTFGEDLAAFAEGVKELEPQADGLREPWSRDHRVASRFAVFEAWIEAQIEYERLVGLSVVVVHDQEIVYAKGFGYADVARQKAARPDTIYSIASQSKLFTSIAILQLRDKGALKLDDPVEAYLPWFKPPANSPNSSPITIRHLLTHTSGLAHDPRSANGTLPWTHFAFPTEEELITGLAVQERVRRPGDGMNYSNQNMLVAGLLVEAVSGQSYAEYIREHILQPLRMVSSGIGPAEHLRCRFATGYGRRRPRGRVTLPIIDFGTMAPAAGMFSTALDLARFASWQFRTLQGRDSDVLAGPSLREMQRPHWLDPQWTYGVGLGFLLLRQPERILVGHDGLVPGHRTVMFLSPEEKLAVIVLANSSDARVWPGDYGNITDRLLEWTAPAILRELRLPSSSRAGARESFRRLEGLYRETRDTLEDEYVLTVDSKLVMFHPDSLSPRKRFRELMPVGNNVFRLSNDDWYDGEFVIFDLSDTGPAKGLTFTGAYYERVR